MRVLDKRNVLFGRNEYYFLRLKHILSFKSSLQIQIIENEYEFCFL